MVGILYESRTNQNKFTRNSANLNANLFQTPCSEPLVNPASSVRRRGPFFPAQNRTRASQRERRPSRFARFFCLLQGMGADENERPYVCGSRLPVETGSSYSTKYFEVPVPNNLLRAAAKNRYTWSVWGQKQVQSKIK